jgi:hypothetical protein
VPPKHAGVNRAATMHVRMTGAGSSNAANARKDMTRAWIRIGPVSNRNNRLRQHLQRVRR